MTEIQMAPKCYLFLLLLLFIYTGGQSETSRDAEDLTVQTAF